MNQHRRPPVDIAPEDFFAHWLPDELQRLAGETGLPPTVVRFSLSGEGGGSWDLFAEGGRVACATSPCGRPAALTLRLSVQDWRAIIVGEPGPVDLAPPTASATDLLFVDHASQQMLQDIVGVFRFEVRGYNGRTWTLTALFGAHEGPQRTGPADAVLRTDAETYAAILARQLPAPEAYFSGRIEIEGDEALGMQVGLALLPKF